MRWLMAREEVDNCWRRIGVWAKQGASCPILSEAIHCRNCDVYINAGREMLNRENLSNAKDMFERSKSYTLPIENKKVGTNKITVFRLGAEWFSLDSAMVREIIEPGMSRWVPHVSGGLVEGVANINGDPLLVISLKKLLGVDELTIQDKTLMRRVYPRWVVIEDDKGALAFLADEVYGTFRYLPEELREVPETVGKTMMSYVKGLVDVETWPVGILDGGLLLYGIEQGLR